MIEDDLRLAQMVGEYLGQSACSSRTAPTRQRPGAPAGPGRRHLPDLVILDLMLPDMDGWKSAAASARCPGRWRRCRC
jgi:DNA-binding response OmpR family regulator